MRRWYVFLFLILFLCFTYKVDASTTGTYICTDGDTMTLNVRNSINGSPVSSLACNSTVEILDTNAGSNSICSNWYKIKYGVLTGYSCGDFISINSNTNTNLKGRVSCVENDDPISVRDSINGKIVDSLSCDVEMDIINANAGGTSRCSNYYYVSYGNNKKGYVCGSYVLTEASVDYNSDNVINYKDGLKSAGFPDSYLDDIVKLHALHPSWVFKPFKTGLDWNTVIENESVKSRNLIYYTYGEGYRSKESYSYNYATDEYYRHSTETNWWYASPEAISYYMDPRNYLDSNNVFVFESLSYEPVFQTEEVVGKILDNSFMPSLYAKYSDSGYASAFMEAANTYRVSPVHLASRILQEQGINGSIASLGESFTYNGNSYSGYFNFYNIKATGANPAINGLVWAMGGLDHSATSYGRPWDTPYKSIMGGAKFLSEDYISIGQNTLYFEKFAVSVSSGRYTHQYMQNITAPLTEGIKSYNSYAKINGLFDEAIVFIIPVYNNMPSSKVSAPLNKNPNSYLKSITINGKNLSEFSYNNLNYELTLEDSEITIGASSINSKASISGTGKIKLNNGLNTINILVTSESGNKTTYTLKINKKVNEEELTLSSINTLKNLKIDKINFDFSKDKLEYNLEVEYEIDKINITYELDDDSSTVTPMQEVILKVGLNKITIKVTAENGNEKVYILNITRKEISIDKALNSSGFKYNDNYIYGININTNVNSLVNNIKKVSSSLVVTVKDKNGTIKTGIFKTGDKVTITSGNINKNYEILIYGDVNGDGAIDKLDYLAVLRQYYGYASYSGVYKVAADVNRDDKIDKLDYLAILRQYYGYAKISQ